MWSLNASQNGRSCSILKINNVAHGKCFEKKCFDLNGNDNAGKRTINKFKVLLRDIWSHGRGVALAHFSSWNSISNLTMLLLDGSFCMHTTGTCHCLCVFAFVLDGNLLLAFMLFAYINALTFCMQTVKCFVHSEQQIKFDSQTKILSKWKSNGNGGIPRQKKRRKMKQETKCYIKFLVQDILLRSRFPL